MTEALVPLVLTCSLVDIGTVAGCAFFEACLIDIITSIIVFCSSLLILDVRF